MDFFPCFGEESPSDDLLRSGGSGVDRLESKSRELERRLRREIANSNERRRMQSINTGFKTLKATIPHDDGEKISKASILQRAAEYIYSMQQEMDHLSRQNTRLRWLLDCAGPGGSGSGSGGAGAGVVDETHSLFEGTSRRRLGACGDSDGPRPPMAASIIEARHDLERLRSRLDREMKRRRSNVEVESVSVGGSFRDSSGSESGLPASPCSGDPSCPRGSLDTILKAIQHVEGDTVFANGERRV
eukprot:m.41756 g.41756  ORF g.41756 m.41756 type:complete len:245 (+) comp33245_c0_seq2:72-806(+)